MVGVYPISICRLLESPMNDSIKPYRILVVEDDTEIARLSRMLLVTEGYQCEVVHNGNEAESKVCEFNPHVVVLDIMLPGKNGIDVCADLRRFYTGAILMLTGKDGDLSELTSFKSGADDYVLKPVKPHLLLARIEALLKRICVQTESSTEEGLLKVADLSFNTQRREVEIEGRQTVSLTTAEAELLQVLMASAGKVVSREQCCSELRGLCYDGMDRSIDMRVSSLRKKLGNNQQHQQRVVTVRGQGYLLVDH